MNIQVKILDKDNSFSYREFKLYSLSESPFAFSESHQDELLKTTEAYSEEIAPYGNPPEKFVLGAFADDHSLVGFLTFKRDPRSKARHKSMLHSLYVLPEYRHKGIGKLLLDKAISMAAHLGGLEQIHLWVLQSTSSASAFYLKAGFESQGTIVKNDLKIGGEYVDAEYMVYYFRV